MVAFFRALAVLVLIGLSPPAFAQVLVETISGASSARANDVQGGGQGGYNWQNGSVVYGLEADISATNLNNSTSAALACAGALSCSVFGPSAANLSSRIDWYGTVRGRLGLASGPVLFYATGGLAYGQADLTSSFSVGPSNSGAPVVSLSAQAGSIKTGWVFGGGIDYMLHPNMVVSFGYPDAER